MKIDWEKYRRDIVISIFHLLDPDCARELSFDCFWNQLTKIGGGGKFSLAFVEMAIEMKEEDRVFTRQLRSTKICRGMPGHKMNFSHLLEKMKDEVQEESASDQDIDQV
jgi:hypothetical protein